MALYTAAPKDEVGPGGSAARPEFMRRLVLIMHGDSFPPGSTIVDQGPQPPPPPAPRAPRGFHPPGPFP